MCEVKEWTGFMRTRKHNNLIGKSDILFSESSETKTVLKLTNFTDARYIPLTLFNKVQTLNVKLCQPDSH